VLTFTPPPQTHTHSQCPSRGYCAAGRARRAGCLINTRRTSQIHTGIIAGGRRLCASLSALCNIRADVHSAAFLLCLPTNGFNLIRPAALAAARSQSAEQRDERAAASGGGCCLTPGASHPRLSRWMCPRGMHQHSLTLARSPVLPRAEFGAPMADFAPPESLSRSRSLAAASFRIVGG
jgi:hypothetical protein